ncbi:fatty acid desaturase family protein [Micromonospora sp. NPDC005257]|uniref:fatty acid desaturase family protein n=1 Tax=Micromonospora sp. NPDC005257 TaxID=3364230 RepID=UPI0036CC58AE
MSTIDQTIGAAPPGSQRRHGSDYAELLSRVRQAGLLERRPTYYLVLIAVNAVLVAEGWTIFVLAGDSWWQLVTAAYLAVVFTQSGFLGHDAGHRQIFRSRRANHLVGLVYGNLAIGLAFGWWVDKHHRHHAHPNTEGRDPDIAGEALAFTRAQADRRRGAGRLLARHQRLLFFPMLLLEGVALHVASVRALSRSTYRGRGREALLLGLHAAAYLTAVFVVLSPLRAVAFVVVQQGLFGLYLGCAFAPNHKGMPILGADDEVDFLRRQVLTSRNVRGNRLVDLLLGGLNHQIEHHLFPSMPRAALRHARPIVRAFCREHDLPYVETGLLDSYRQALRHLHRVGRNARPAGESASPVEPTGPTGPAARLREMQNVDLR